jgi:hypothetical protein
MDIFLAFLAFIVLAALIRSGIAGDYRGRVAESVVPSEPLEPDPAVEALKADLRRQFAAEEMRGY